MSEAQSGAVALEPAPSAPPDRESLRASHAEDDRSRVTLAVLTASCAVLGLLGWVGTLVGGISATTATGLYVASYVTGGFDSARRAIKALAGGSLSVDLLMVLAALGAAAVGEWPEGAVLLFLFSLSNTLEQLILGRTRRAIAALMDLSPEEAVVERGGVEARVPVGDLAIGDVIIVRPGERIAADGLILEGRTSVDQSAMTGESIPVDRGPGEHVFAATLNGPGALRVEVTRRAGETTLARVVKLVEEAQAEKAPSQRFTEWFGQKYTLAVLAAAAATMALPASLGLEPFARSFYRAMTVLVVASPCAVVISIPAAILSAIAGAARRGILFKGGAHLEQAAALRAVAFDKTGTLTVGKPRLVDLIAVEGFDPHELLRLAAAAEGLSEHPLSRAVAAAAREKGMDLPPARNLEALVGRGLRAEVDGRDLWIGKPSLFRELGLDVPQPLLANVVRLSREGMTVVLVGHADRVLGALAIADTVRPSAAEALRDLRLQGFEHLLMITGDQKEVAASIAGRLGMGFEAELLPEDKLKVIHRLRAQYEHVAMVGDGINDAPALAAATLGISLGGGGAADVALETADIVLMADDLGHLPDAIALAREARRVIRQNLAFAFGVMAVLLGVTLFATLPLPLAVVGHEGSTVLVILNGARLLRYSRQRDYKT